MTRSLAPIRHEIHVRCGPDHAFAVFTAGMGRWWPLESHSIAAMTGGPPAIDVRVDGCVDGSIVEHRADGSTCMWGTVLVWEPPARIVIRWTVSETGAPTTIDVRFAPVDGGTRVTLVHGDWDTAERRSSYDENWPGVLARFAGRAVPGA